MESEAKSGLGYQAAIAMISMQASIIWSTFNSILAANALLIAICGAWLEYFSHVRWGAAILAIGGLLVCGAWFFSLKRQFAYQEYWFAMARSLEDAYLGPEIKMIALGRTFGQGAEIEIPKVGKMQIAWGATAFKVQWLVNIIIAVFAAIYLLVLYAVLTK
jgi:hypothetical protein